MNKKPTAAKPAERTRTARTTVPEPVEEVIVVKAPVNAPPVSAEETAAKAYEFFRVSIDGDFPAWEDVSGRGRDLYRDGTRYVIEGGEPRTDFERVVVEVLHG